MSGRIYDFAAVGLGPFNLGLACLTEPLDDLEGIFLEQNAAFDWHPGMLLEGATLQTPFLSDLVTLADPTNRYSFLNYSKQTGRIYSFYIRESFFLLRNEYNQYCRWAAEQLGNIVFNTRVERIEYSELAGCYVIRAADACTNNSVVYRARKLVLGTGTTPSMPACCHELGDRAVHSSQYLFQKPRLQESSAITVIGSGQSAAEIVNDLLDDIDRDGYRLSWITSSPRFFPLDYSSLTLEMTSPEYVDYFHSLPPDQRDRVLAAQQDLYKGIDRDLISNIRERLYEKQTVGEIDVELRTHCKLVRAEREAASDRLNLEFHQLEQDRLYAHATDTVVLATGYKYAIPGFIEGIADRIRRDDAGRFDVARNYSVDVNGGEIFIQNGELHTHGFVSPDLGMGCYRNSCIIRELTGRECYPIERRIGFQEFGVPDSAWCPVTAREASALHHAGGQS
ncbi:MAG: lysine N(6)-hydroxylase/L-ornithine N(5)-oxygenase family protein [Halofilum sp. (in: g-proteobacteria)]